MASQSEKLFEKILNTKILGQTVGKNLTVTTNTELPDIKDEDGHSTFQESINTLFAQINIGEATYKNVEGVLVKIGDSKAAFQKKDIGYLNSDSYVDVTVDGEDFHFKMVDVVPTLINVSVTLKREE